MVCTDAAGEGLNMQFAWRLLNWDIPWNPARLEQRMGRIHRYKQEHDPVIIANLVAGKTREGRVMKTLLDKLERIRKELGRDKVFDVIGRLFEGVSIKEYMERAVTTEGAEAACRVLEGTLTKEQVEALEAKERRLYGDGGDVKAYLAAERAKLDREGWRRLLPGYVRRFIEKSAPLLDLGIEGDLDETFALKPLRPGALDFLWNLLETYPPARRQRLTVHKPKDADEALFLHPGEPVFDRLAGPRLRAVRRRRPPGRGLRGPDGDCSRTCSTWRPCRCRGRRTRRTRRWRGPRSWNTGWSGCDSTEDGTVEPCPVEHLLLLKGGRGVPADARPRWPSRAGRVGGERHESFAAEKIARAPGRGAPPRAVWRICPRGWTSSRGGSSTRTPSWPQARGKLRDKAQAGDPRAKGELTKIKDRQKALAARREAHWRPCSASRS